MNTPKQSRGRLKFYLALVVSAALIALDILTDTPINMSTFLLIFFALYSTAHGYSKWMFDAEMSKAYLIVLLGICWLHGRVYSHYEYNTKKKISQRNSLPLAYFYFSVALKREMYCWSWGSGYRIKIIKYIDWEDVEEPCKGDTHV